MPKTKDLAKIFITKRATIKQAMKQLTESAMQILLVIDRQKRLIGTITDGDIRRALLNNINLGNSINKIVNKKPKFLYETEQNNAVEFMQRHSVFQVPVLNRDNRVIDIILWKDADGNKNLQNYKKNNNFVFILAGGEGTRLDPFTKILPKPLIPFNDKPILEIVMENFKNYGFDKFIISLNYKAEMIKMYFKENQQRFNITYIEEKNFLGTAGSLSLIKDKTDKPIIVSNCDVILNTNFNELLDYHLEKKNDFTIVGIIRHIKIPYGIVKIKNGDLRDFIEKPEYDFIVNAGNYVIEPRIIELIDRNQHIDMPELIIKAKQKGYKVGVYPVGSDWVDIGQWEEYKKALEHFNNLGLT